MNQAVAVRTTQLGTPLSPRWSRAWAEQVEAREGEYGHRICGARTPADTPCPLESTHLNGRCRFHGGHPNVGAPEGNRNAMVHGLYSRRLQQCGEHCAVWQHCPMAGPDVTRLPAPERPLCVYEQTDYDNLIRRILSSFPSTEKPKPPPSTRWDDEEEDERDEKHERPDSPSCHPRESGDLYKSSATRAGEADETQKPFGFDDASADFGVATGSRDSRLRGNDNICGTRTGTDDDSPTCHPERSEGSTPNDSIAPTGTQKDSPTCHPREGGDLYKSLSTPAHVSDSAQTGIGRQHTQNHTEVAGLSSDSRLRGNDNEERVANEETKFENDPQPDPLTAMAAHTTTLLHIMVNRSAAALRVLPLTDASHAESEHYRMHTPKVGAALEALMRISREYRLWLRALTAERRVQRGEAPDADDPKLGLGMLLVPLLEKTEGVLEAILEDEREEQRLIDAGLIEPDDS